MLAPSIVSLEHCRYCGHGVGDARRHHGARLGFRYGDGTPICAPCHQTAIKTDAELLGAWQLVVSQCLALGLHANWQDVKVRLRQSKQLHAMASSVQGVVGLARSRRWAWLVSSDITILYGMPLTHAIETLAHEAGHVWCHAQGVVFDPQDVEEGFCNVVACLVLQRLDARHHTGDRVQVLFANSDPVYGLRFREEWLRVNQTSWPRYLQLIQTGGFLDHY